MSMRREAAITLFVVIGITTALLVRWPAGTPGKATKPAALALSTSAHTPVRLDLSGEMSGGSLRLVVRLARSELYASLPARLELRLPDGVTLTEGEPAVGLGVGTNDERTYEARVEGTPTEDVVAIVTISGEGRTARGEAHYRFGRPAPRLPEPERRPPLPVRGGKSLGTGIRVSPTVR